jgi:hypothetical protein
MDAPLTPRTVRPAVSFSLGPQEDSELVMVAPDDDCYVSMYCFLNKTSTSPVQMAIWTAQPSTARARGGPGTTGTSTTQPDGLLSALRAELEAHHEHEANFS